MTCSVTPIDWLKGVTQYVTFFPTVHSIVFGVKQQRCYNVLVQLIVAKLSSVGKL